MVENTTEFEVKRYLIKLISDKYKLLRSQIYKAFGQTGYAMAYNEIANRFMGGTYTTERKRINIHKEKFVSKGYADYNYFDLDSLYAYLEYLTMLVSNIEDYSYRNGKYVVDKNVFYSALNDTLRFFNGNQDKPVTGYYRGYVTLSTKGGSDDELNPVKTSNDKVDMSKSREYQKYIKEYFEKKYAKRNAIYEQLNIDSTPWQYKKEENVKEDDGKEEFLVSPEDSIAQSFEIIPYKFRNKKFNLYISKEERFYADNGYPVYRIVAVSRYGKLWRTVDIDDNVYNGALYNEEFEEVAGAEESGETFYPSQELLRLVGTKPSKKDSEESSTKVKYKDDFILEVDD